VDLKNTRKLGFMKMHWKKYCELKHPISTSPWY
jgi:hypothetical protein